MGSHGLSVDPTDVTELSTLLRSLPYLTDGAAADSALVELFNHAYKIAYLTLLVGWIGRKIGRPSKFRPLKIRIKLFQ
ncbi:hypothetical protein HDU84_006145 [Entophlyctis sp. JEL0112]|nr:hypothetical protein HDU84_006145 [Entophlyctis sp. JEL0112]